MFKRFLSLNHSTFRIGKTDGTIHWWDLISNCLFSKMIHMFFEWKQTLRTGRMNGSYFSVIKEKLQEDNIHKLHRFSQLFGCGREYPNGVNISDCINTEQIQIKWTPWKSSGSRKILSSIPAASTCHSTVP